MEFHQVRYFLALATTLNFTRAAEMCNVTQPALTRSIKALEYELGGPLLTREGRLSHLTELGERLLPVLQECFKKATAAKAVARACMDGKRGALRLAIVGSVDLERIVVPLGEVIADFPEIEISVMRGSNEQILEYLKSGEATFAISDSDLGSWERLDCWLIDREPYTLVANRLHRFAAHQPVPATKIAEERLICLPYCSLARELVEMADDPQQAATQVCQVDTLSDIFTLLKLNVGVAVLPKALTLPDGLMRIHTTGVELEHATHLYAVAGRRRGTAAAEFVAHFERKARSAKQREIAVAASAMASRAIELTRAA